MMNIVVKEIKLCNFRVFDQFHGEFSVPMYCRRIGNGDSADTVWAFTETMKLPFTRRRNNRVSSCFHLRSPSGICTTSSAGLP